MECIYYPITIDVTIGVFVALLMIWMTGYGLCRKIFTRLQILWIWPSINTPGNIETNQAQKTAQINSHIILKNKGLNDIPPLFLYLHFSDNKKINSLWKGELDGDRLKIMENFKNKCPWIENSFGHFYLIDKYESIRPECEIYNKTAINKDVLEMIVNEKDVPRLFLIEASSGRLYKEVKYEIDFKGFCKRFRNLLLLDQTTILLNACKYSHNWLEQNDKQNGRSLQNDKQIQR